MVEIKCWGVNDRLHGALELLEPQLVENQAQDDRHREAPQKGIQAQLDGVPQHPVEVGRPEEALEPLPAHPRAAGDAQARVVVAEGDLDAVHGAVLVHDGDDHRDQQQHVKLPVICDALAQPFLLDTPGSNGRSHRHSSCSIESVHETFHDVVHKISQTGPLVNRNFGFSEQIFPRFSVNVCIKEYFYMQKKNKPRSLTFVRENVIIIS